MIRFMVLCVSSILLTCLAGCQVDLSGHVGTKAFYPDKVGDTKYGDPRKPMYEGSGYTEQTTSGGKVEEGFPGMDVKKAEKNGGVR